MKHLLCFEKCLLEVRARAAIIAPFVPQSVFDEVHYMMTLFLMERCRLNAGKVRLVIKSLNHCHVNTPHCAATLLQLTADTTCPSGE